MVNAWQLGGHTIPSIKHMMFGVGIALIIIKKKKKKKNLLHQYKDY